MTSGMELVEVAFRVRTAFVAGVPVPTANCLVVLFQKNLVSSPPRVPELLNWTAPLAPPGLDPPTHVPFTAKHPAVRLIPLAAVELAVDDVMFKRVT